MQQPFQQGFLDNMCGVYSIINAERYLNKSKEEESQKLFYELIELLAKKRKLKDVVNGGINHKIMTFLVYGTLTTRVPEIITNKKGFYNLTEWWKYSKAYLEEKEGRAIIISMGGRRDHLSVVEVMTERTVRLLDSNWTRLIKRKDCCLAEVGKEDQIDKYTIYATQCWYLGNTSS